MTVLFNDHIAVNGIEERDSDKDLSLPVVLRKGNSTCSTEER